MRLYCEYTYCKPLLIYEIDELTVTINDFMHRFEYKGHKLNLVSFLIPREY